MKRWWLALGLAGCAGNDGFRQRAEQKCHDLASCRSLQVEAQYRTLRCKDNTVGEIRCSDAEADLAWLRGQIEMHKTQGDQAFRQQTVQREEARREEQKQEREDEAARKVKAEEDRRQAERSAAEAKEAEAKRACDEARATEENRTPFERARFIAEQLRGVPQASDVCKAGWQADKITGDARKEPEVAKVLAAYRKEEQRVLAELKADATQNRGLLCGDGTESGCACQGSHRGCCSGHGGVRGCAPVGAVALGCGPPPDPCATPLRPPGVLRIKKR